MLLGQPLLGQNLGFAPGRDQVILTQGSVTNNNMSNPIIAYQSAQETIELQ